MWGGWSRVPRLNVSFANEVGSVFNELGVDGRRAMDIFCKDHMLNVSAAYLRPGYTFGGSCLAKDVRAFTHLARMLDVDLPVLENVLPNNDRHIDRLLQSDVETTLAGAELLIVANASPSEVDAIVRAKLAIPIVNLHGVDALATPSTADYRGLGW